jgi:hypothetical protein
MIGKARKTIRGAARYTYLEKDSKTIRFTTSRSRKIILSHLIDISETGIAFATSHKVCPRIGEIIKMDFAPPGSFKIALEGRVVRIEEPTKYSGWARFPGTVKVGLEFYRVPRPYQKILSATIKNFLVMRQVDQNNKLSLAPTRISKENGWFKDNIISVGISFVLISLFTYGIYFFLNDYDPSKHSDESAWAQGFFDKVVKPQKNKF